MAISRIQSTTGVTNGFTGTCSTTAFGTTPTAGNTIVVGITSQGGANDISGVSDTAGNSFARVAQVNNGGSQDNEIWVAHNILSHASNIVTATNSSFGFLAVEAEEWAGLATSAAFDIKVSGTGTGNGNLATSTSSSTTVANEMVYAVGSVSSSPVTWTTGTGYSNRVDFNNSSALSSSAESKIISATATQTAILTSSVTNQNWCIVLATFADTPVSSNPTVNVSDSITVTESKSVGVASFVNKSDTITTTENSNVPLVDNVTVSDSMTVTETIGRMTDSSIAVADTVTTTDNSNVAVVFNVHVEPGIQDIRGPRVV